jgi:hypothetical protein
MRASHKGQKPLNRGSCVINSRMALLAVLGASVGPIDGERNEMARWVDYYSGRRGGPKAHPTADRPARCEGAAAQRGGCGGIAGSQPRRPCVSCCVWLAGVRRLAFEPHPAAVGGGG